MILAYYFFGDSMSHQQIKKKLYADDAFKEEFKNKLCLAISKLLENEDSSQIKKLADELMKKYFDTRAQDDNKERHTDYYDFSLNLNTKIADPFVELRTFLTHKSQDIMKQDDDEDVKRHCQFLVISVISSAACIGLGAIFSAITYITGLLAGTFIPGSIMAVISAMLSLSALLNVYVYCVFAACCLALAAFIAADIVLSTFFDFSTTYFFGKTEKSFHVPLEVYDIVPISNHVERVKISRSHHDIDMPTHDELAKEELLKILAALSNTSINEETLPANAQAEPIKCLLFFCAGVSLAAICSMLIPLAQSSIFSYLLFIVSCAALGSLFCAWHFLVIIVAEKLQNIFSAYSPKGKDVDMTSGDESKLSCHV